MSSRLNGTTDVVAGLIEPALRYITTLAIAAAWPATSSEVLMMCGVVPKHMQSPLKLYTYMFLYMR